MLENIEINIKEDKEDKENIKILGIETSCDETAASVVINGRIVKSNVISSSSEYQSIFGGVVPEVASRKHIENIGKVVDKSLKDAKITLKEINAIAVTNSPGLIGSLLVGLNFAKALSYASNIPFIAVNHLHGHISSCYLESNIKPPFMCLIVSGGHTLLVHVKDYLKNEILGTTTDDAVGEAYDKIARILDLPYPGGPKLDNLASIGKKNIDFPMSFANDGLNFSYSGLKSSVINYINTQKMKNSEIIKEDIAASFQKAAIDILIIKIKRALENTKLNTVAICGGVACNSYLRYSVSKLAKEENVNIHIPKTIYCTDNGAMIASAGFYKFLNKEFSDLATNAYSTNPHII
ncbi:MAG: tRNA (adenosine(37)-N6)-threonylcarbamoyltransferase complex transferase subunit TsaD [Defluviitaleaceae bacterium]|nr:tRNA (adenosine(37)-N6)-threonylcarbamoyltransferase complex transferase subunit TsaD [Defluviitaleaceae bacterium]